MSSLRNVRRAVGSSRLWNALAVLAGIGAFVQETTAADQAYNANYNYGSNINKAKTIGNWLISRISLGTVPYAFGVGAGVLGGTKPGFNDFGRVLNKYTGIGIGAMLYSFFSRKVYRLPMAGKVEKFGKPLIAAGIAGGILGDAPYSSPLQNRISGSASGVTVSTGVNQH